MIVWGRLKESRLGVRHTWVRIPSPSHSKLEVFKLELHVSLGMKPFQEGSAFMCSHS